MESFENWLRAPARGLLPDSVLSQPVSQLQGVTADAEQALAEAGILTILDLGASALFGLARAIADAADGIDRLGAPGALPADMIDDSARGASASAVAAMSPQILRALTPGLASRFEAALPAATVRDLGYWPPALAASRLVRIAFGGVDEAIDPEAPPELQPRMGRLPVDRIQYDVLLFEGTIGKDGCTIVQPEKPDEPGAPLPETVGPDLGHHDDATKPGEAICGPALEGVEFPVDLTDRLLGQGFQEPGFGFVLTIAQSWYSVGLSLGHLLHSLALAPGEATRIAVVDWTRKVTVATAETILEDETLKSDIERNRSVTEVANAVNKEAQQGFSSFNTTAAGWGIGGGAAYGAQATVPVSGVPVDMTGAAALGFGYSRNDAEGAAFASSQGSRAVAADMAQKAHDRTQQYASLSRGRRASIVSEVSVSEAERLSTRIVANYNHMHALSVLYFEVVQLYRVVTECVAAEPIVYIPVRPLDFSRQDLLERHRALLASAALTREAQDALLGIVRASKPSASGDAESRGDWEMSFFSPAVVPEVFDQRGTLLRDEALRRVLGANAAVGPNLFRFSPRHARLTEIQLGSVDASRKPIADTLVLAGRNTLEIAIRQWATPPRDPAKYLPDRSESLTAFRAELPANWERRENAVAIETKADWRWDEAVKRGELAFDPRVLFRLELKDPETGKDLGGFVQFSVAVPATRADGGMRLASLRFAAVEAAEAPKPPPAPAPPFDLAGHLRAHAMHYTMAVLRRADTSLLGFLLAGLRIDGRSLLGQVDPVPIATSGNYLVFRWPALRGSALWARLRRLRGLADANGAHAVGRRELLVPLASGGVFAEAVLGRFNSAEKLDLTRFWNWQDSPMPLVPPEIAPLQAGLRQGAAAMTPGQLGPANLQQKDAPALPDPSGTIAKALEVAGKADAFRDMTGLNKLLEAGGNATTLAAQGAKGFMETAMQTVTAYGARVNHGKDMDERAKKEDAAKPPAKGAPGGTPGGGAQPGSGAPGGGTPGGGAPASGTPAKGGQGGGGSKVAPGAGAGSELMEKKAFVGPEPSPASADKDAASGQESFSVLVRIIDGETLPGATRPEGSTRPTAPFPLRLVLDGRFLIDGVRDAAEPIYRGRLPVANGIGRTEVVAADQTPQLLISGDLAVTRLSIIASNVARVRSMPGLPPLFWLDGFRDLMEELNRFPVAGDIVANPGAGGTLALDLIATRYYPAEIRKNLKTQARIAEFEDTFKPLTVDFQSALRAGMSDDARWDEASRLLLDAMRLHREKIKRFLRASGWNPVIGYDVDHDPAPRTVQLTPIWGGLSTIQFRVAEV